MLVFTVCCGPPFVLGVQGARPATQTFANTATLSDETSDLIAV
jgi:hypothetical protein